MASEIVVTLIGGGAGLATGVVGSLFAPWANWGVEKQRRKQDRRVERIKEWRSGVAALRFAERNHYKALHGEDDSPPFPGLKAARDHFTKPDCTRAPWFVTLRKEAAPHTVARVEGFADEPIEQSFGKVPDMLEKEIARIERDKWKLV